MDAVFDHGGGAPCPANFNMAAYVLARADELADKVALSIVGGGGQQDWRYGDLKRAILGTATGLLQAGIAPGQHLLLRLGNSVEFPITYLAAISVGIIPVPTSAQLTRDEISVIARTLQPRAVVAAPGVALPASRVPVHIAAQELADMHRLAAARFDLGDANRPAYVIFTSGTSGGARGVVHAHRAIWARRMMWDGWYGLREDDRLLHAGAFNWTYTLGTGLMDPWARGATALIPKAGTAAPDLPDLMARQRASIFAAAPGIYRQMLKRPLPPLPDLRHGLSAGEKLPEATATAWRAATGKPLYEAFGMSECSTFISCAPGQTAPPGSLGYVQRGRRVAILRDGHPVHTGQPGVIAIARHDPGLMLGYLNDATATRAKFQGDWFLTGDRGAMDADGAVTYLGRDDDMMNAGGYRVSPIEVEAAMRDHPGIAECAAVELPVRADASIIALFYTGDAALGDSDLAAHAAAHLARYKQPRLFRHLPELPHGANGKLLRRALREVPPPG
jgi:acyl-coenzyme A synthetase/AMP-(fatty) acid ligase